MNSNQQTFESHCKDEAKNASIDKTTHRIRALVDAMQRDGVDPVSSAYSGLQLNGRNAEAWWPIIESDQDLIEDFVNGLPLNAQDKAERPTPLLDPTSAVPAFRLIQGSTVFDEIVNDLQAGIADKLFDCGDALRGIEIGPGLLTLIGAPPGRGKTALTMQATYEAVSNEPNLRAVVASLEVSEKTLIKRRLAKLIGASFDAIRFNTLTDYQRECIANFTDFRETLESIDFVPESMCGLGDLEVLLNSGIEPGLLVIDYIQLFGSDGEDAKVRAAQTMATARRFCAEGWAVVAVSALSRGQSVGKKGRYSNADLGSFRDSSAIEYSGAAAYMLEEADDSAEDEPAPIRQMRLRCLKNRNGERRHIDLWFNGPQMFFAPVNTLSDTTTATDMPSRPTDDELEQMFP